MTALAKRISETPMAPYTTLLRAMSPRHKQIVMTFLTESMKEDEDTEPALTEEEKEREFWSLCGCWADDPEDAARMEAAIKDGRKNEYMLDVNLDD
jgi:hypothetical protein